MKNRCYHRIQQEKATLGRYYIEVENPVLFQFLHYNLRGTDFNLMQTSYLVKKKKSNCTS